MLFLPALVPLRPVVTARAHQPLAVEPPAGVVVLGPGSLDLRLIAGKLTARAGFATALVAGEGAQLLWRRQMYGKDYAAAGVDEPDCARLCISGEEIGSALSTASALLAVCDEAPLAESALTSALEVAPDLERIVLLSKMGVTRATAGPFGLGGGDAKLREGEQTLRAAATKRGIELSIVRVGTLKGGGPGRVEGGTVVSAGGDLGLSKEYYDSIFDLETALVTQSHDKFTLGAKVSAGDPVDLPNPVLRMAYKGSFEPRDDETSRIVAGGAAVAALRHPTPVEVTVSSAKGEAPPTAGQWEAYLNAL